MRKRVFYFGMLLFAAVMVTGCDKSDDEDKKPSNELDGTWIAENYWRMVIIGSEGFFAETNGNGDFGNLLKDGDLVIRKLEKIDANVWKGEEIIYLPESKILIWTPTLYRLNSSKKELTSFAEGYNSITYFQTANTMNAPLKQQSATQQINKR